MKGTCVTGEKSTIFFHMSLSPSIMPWSLKRTVMVSLSKVFLSSQSSTRPISSSTWVTEAK